MGPAPPSGCLAGGCATQVDHYSQYPDAGDHRQAGQVHEAQDQSSELASQDNAGKGDGVSMPLELQKKQQADNVEDAHDCPAEHTEERVGAEGAQQAIHQKHHDDQQRQALARIFGQGFVVKTEQQGVPGMAGSQQNKWVHGLRSGGSRGWFGQFFGDFKIDLAQGCRSTLLKVVACLAQGIEPRRIQSACTLRIRP